MQATSRALAAALLFAPVAAQAQAPAAAVVETASAAERSILISGAEGWLATLRPARRTPELARLRPGERVEAALSRGPLQVATAGGGAAPAGPRAETAQAPDGRRVEISRLRLPAERLDPARGGPDFTGADGLGGALRVADPRLRAALGGLRPGQQVDVVLTRFVVAEPSLEGGGPAGR